MIKIKDLCVSLMVKKDSTDNIPITIEVDYELIDDTLGLSARKVEYKETDDFDLNVPITDFWNQILNSINKG